MTGLLPKGSMQRRLVIQLSLIALLLSLVLFLIVRGMAERAALANTMPSPISVAVAIILSRIVASVIGGNVISALAGSLVVTLLGTGTLAAMLAVALAIVAMQIGRCLHPPGGAVALSVVIGGPGIHAAGFAYAFATVGFNMALLTLAGLAYNRGADALPGFVRRLRGSKPNIQEHE